MLNNESSTPGSGAPESPARERSTPWLVAIALVFGLTGLGYGVHSSGQAAKTLEEQQASFQTTMTQMRQQMQQDVQTLQDRLAQQEAKILETRAAAAPVQPSAANPAPARRVPVRRAQTPAEDARIKQLEQKLADQSEQLSSTQRSVDSARSDLASQISSVSEQLHGSIARTSDQLSGSIARTSEEVAALRRRGERDYEEFDLAKSKVLRRVGPIHLALRKTDTKHKRFNVDLLVEDNRLEKKNVNLMEPVYISSAEFAQPVELVINRVEKDRIKGYVSTPKYKRSALSAPAAGLQPRTPPEPSPIDPK